MSDRGNIIYLYDGSFEGLLCAVFEGFLRHELPEAIEITQNGQQTILSEYLHITTDAQKAERVAKKIIAVSGKAVFWEIYQCYLSNLSDKGLHIFNFIRACLKFGTSVDKRLTIDCVSAVVNAAKAVGSEAHLCKEFIRFSELENGIYYSKIEPINDVLPLLSMHFIHRYRNMPFIIHDIRRNQCLIYNGKDYIIRDTEGMPALKLSGTETKYRLMWKSFYDTIAIKERLNEKCRMTHMPKRYWRCMTEFQIITPENDV